MFERPSKLATIEHHALLNCVSLHWFCIPASVTAIHDLVFHGGGISSIEIEEGSVSFRVEHNLLVDFGLRSLVWVIGCPESIMVQTSSTAKPVTNGTNAIGERHHSNWLS
jgi:hypothetical protein